MREAILLSGHTDAQLQSREGCSVDEACRGTQAVEALSITAALEALETRHGDCMYLGNEILSPRLASQSSRSNHL
ncbi:hypothetical protein SRHO_G00063500 [Serrasalmus rhombeus]